GVWDNVGAVEFEDSRNKVHPIANKRKADWSGHEKRAQHVDCFGRDFNMEEVVVNFANVGYTFGNKVLQLKQFNWEGVRRCLLVLTKDMQLKVTGVIPENFWGLDGCSQPVPIPNDIWKMCQSVEETPRICGRNHQSADDEMTIKCAYRRACRFMDNDNYKEWIVQLQDPKARTWLQNHKELVHMKYFFDQGRGTFDVLSGNMPLTALATNDQTVEKRNLCRLGRG
ncbi:Carnosine synthase 1, partial [Durusdinium trenchii]